MGGDYGSQEHGEVAPMRRDLSGEASTWSATALHLCVLATCVAERCGAGEHFSGGGGVELAVAGDQRRSTMNAGTSTTSSTRASAAARLAREAARNRRRRQRGRGGERGRRVTGDAASCWSPSIRGTTITTAAPSPSTRGPPPFPLLLRANLLPWRATPRDPLHKRAGYLGPQTGQQFQFLAKCQNVDRWSGWETPELAEAAAAAAPSVLAATRPPKPRADEGCGGGGGRGEAGWLWSAAD